VRRNRHRADERTANPGVWTPAGGVTPGGIASPYGRGTEYDGINDQVVSTVPVGGKLQLHDAPGITVSCLARSDATGDLFQRVIEKTTASSGEGGWSFQLTQDHFDGSNHPYVGIWVDSEKFYYSSADSLIAGEWAHYVGKTTWGQESQNAFSINGAPKTPTLTDGAISAPPNVAAGASVGNWPNTSAQWTRPDLVNVNRRFNGGLAEIRVSGIRRPLAWDKAEYANLLTPASFFSFGGIESP